jgi:hypothetical protein
VLRDAPSAQDRLREGSVFVAWSIAIQRFFLASLLRMTGVASLLRMTGVASFFRITGVFAVSR